MKNYFALLGTIFSMAVYGTAASAAIVQIGTLPPAPAYFFITSATAGDVIVTAAFGDTFTGLTAFDDSFQFALPLSGTGSASVSTSFSSISTEIAITSVLINGVSYSPAAAALGITNIPISAHSLNTIEVIGHAASVDVTGTFAGTETFTDPPIAAVPEPATWAMMVVGMGVMGLAVRRRQNAGVACA